MKNITGAQGAFIARLLIEAYQSKGQRILEAGYTGQKKDKLGHTRYYQNGRQVKNPNAKEKSAIHAAASTSLPAGQAPSHNDAATRVDALHADTPPEHVAALANDLMKMSVEDLTKMAKAPAKSTPPSPQQQMLNSVGSSGKADGKRTLEKTGKLPHELTLNEFAAVVDPHNAKWQNKEDPSEQHLAWVKAAMVHEPEKVPASVLQMYADKDASISNELQSRSADKPAAAATAAPAPTAGMSADANALDALRLKSNKKTHNPAHINPEALSSLKAQGFIDDKNKLTPAGRTHLYAEKLKGAPAPTGTAAATPAAPKPKWKRANRNKDSLISIVKRKGGINSKSLKTDYDYQADIIEGGLLHAIRKQGMGLDEMAASLQVEGHIVVPEGVDPGDYLLDRMKGRHHSALKNYDKELASDEEAYYKAKQEAQQGGHDEQAIESSRTSGTEIGVNEGGQRGSSTVDEWDNSGAGETGSGEKSGTVSGDGYDSADTDDYDRNASSGEVDNSFDFGANADEPKADEAPAPTAAAPPPDDAVARHMQRQAFTGIDAQGRQWQNGELVAAKDDEPATPAGKAEPEPEPKANEKEQPETIGKGSTGDVTKQGDQVYKTANENESNAYSKLAGIDGVAPGKLEGDKIVTPFYKHVISVDTIPYEKRQTLGPILKPNLGRMVNAVTALSDEGLSYNDPLQFGFDKDKKSNLLDFSMAEKVDNAPRENLSALANYLKQFGLSKHGDAMTQVALVSDYITPGSRWLDDDSTDSIDGAKIEANLDGKPGKYAYYSFNARTIPGVAQTGHRDAANVIFSDKPLSNEFMETWEIHPAIHRTDAKADEPEPKAAPEPAVAPAAPAPDPDPDDDRSMPEHEAVRQVYLLDLPKTTTDQVLRRLNTNLQWRRKTGKISGSNAYTQYDIKLALEEVLTQKQENKQFKKNLDQALQSQKPNLQPLIQERDDELAVLTQAKEKKGYYGVRSGEDHVRRMIANSKIKIMNLNQKIIDLAAKAPAAAAPEPEPVTEPSTPVAPAPMDEETYLATNGASRQDIGEPALHRQPRAKPNQIEKNANRQLEKDYELTGRRDDLRKEYADKVASGEIRPPTRTEKLIQSANGHEDNESTQAARRMLQKSGIDWNQPAPPPSPGEADTPPAAKWTAKPPRANKNDTWGRSDFNDKGELITGSIAGIPITANYQRTFDGISDQTKAALEKEFSDPKIIAALKDAGIKNLHMMEDNSNAMRPKWTMAHSQGSLLFNRLTAQRIKKNDAIRARQKDPLKPRGLRGVIFHEAGHGLYGKAGKDLRNKFQAALAKHPEVKDFIASKQSIKAPMERFDDMTPKEYEGREVHAEVYAIKDFDPERFESFPEEIKQVVNEIEEKGRTPGPDEDNSTPPPPPSPDETDTPPAAVTKSKSSAEMVKDILKSLGRPVKSDAEKKLEKLEQQRVDLNKQGANSRSSIVSKQRKRIDLDERIQRLRAQTQNSKKTTTEAVMPATDPHAAKIKLIQAIIARRGITPPQPKAQAKKIPEANEDPRVKRIRELMDAYC